jgi:hypothetical protein
MMLDSTLEIEIASLERRHLSADELRTAMIAICNSAEVLEAQCYWFKCSSCNARTRTTSGAGV